MNARGPRNSLSTKVSIETSCIHGNNVQQLAAGVLMSMAVIGASVWLDLLAMVLSAMTLTSVN